MAEQSEAACLIESGAAFGRRTGLRDKSGATVFAGVKPGAFSLYFDDEPYYHLDLDGRWQRALIAGVHYLKGLDTSVVAIERHREGESMVLRRRTLPFAEAADLDARIRDTALTLIEEIRDDHWRHADPTDAGRRLDHDELIDILERIADWDAAAWFRHRERYLGTYGALPFLPPEAQQAVVIQANLGHATGVAFGGAPPSESYSRNAQEFRQHLREVAELLGRRIGQCRHVVLIGGDALHEPADVTLDRLIAIGETFPINPEAPAGRLADRLESNPLAGIIATLDDLRSPLPARDDWPRFRQAGLVRLAIGIESGDPAIRAAYGKTWGNPALNTLVDDVKAAGIAVSLMTLALAGGADREDDHIVGTAATIGSLPLDRGDFVYLLDPDEVGGPTIRDRAFGSERTPKQDDGESLPQVQLKAPLIDQFKPKKVPVLPYSLVKQRG